MLKGIEENQYFIINSGLALATAFYKKMSFDLLWTILKKLVFMISKHNDFSYF